MFLVLFETIQRNSRISFPMLGNFSINPPSYFTVFGRPIYFYGVLIALGFILAILFCSHISSRFGIQADDFYDLMLWLIPLSILGARLYYVLFRLEDYAGQPARIFAVWEGGLAIYGGIIAGVLCILLVCRHKKIPVAAMLDLAVYGLLIGQILGRWGNFMNREAFGAETDIFCRMGLTAPDGTTIYVHPTFLYESLWNLIGLAGLLILLKKGRRRYDGQCALLYFFWYGLGRAWIEGLRTDSLYIPGSPIRVSQALSLVLVITAAAVLLKMRKRPFSPADLYVNRVAAASAPIVIEKPAPEAEGAETLNTENTEETDNGRL